MAGSPNSGAIRNINSPAAKMPTNRELGFNPEGPGWLGTGARDPLGGIIAFAANQAAREVTNKLYPTTPGGGEADAFRHGAGSRLLQGIVGSARAKNWGDAHEVDGIDPPWIGQALGVMHKNTEGQRTMDLYNNQVGRELPHGRAQDVQDAIKRGLFRLRPFGE